MTKILALITGRINGRSLRERAILLAVVSIATGAFGYFWTLSPTLEAKERIRREVVGKEAEIATLLTQIQTIAKDSLDPDRDNKARISQLKQLITDSETGLNKKRDRIVAPERVANLLEEVLSRHGKLVLVDLKSLPARPLLEQKSEEAASPKQAARKSAEPERTDATDQVRGIYRHGIEIRVQGSYLELLRYLVELEKLPMQVFWSDVTIETKDYPVSELKLTLFTVSFDKVWLTV
ncbi:MAG: hypothetical protein ABIU95_12255 [Burkholderiales bacterium]